MARETDLGLRSSLGTARLEPNTMDAARHRAARPTLRLEFSGRPSHKRLAFSMQAPQARSGYLQTRLTVRRGPSANPSSELCDCPDPPGAIMRP